MSQETINADYDSKRKFTEFPLSADVLKGIASTGYTTATPVQAATIEPGIAGKDLLVRAKTGTGKTAAFSIPIIERIPNGTRHPMGLVLAPTRELAQQIAEECNKLASGKDFTIALLVGGLPLPPQERALSDGAALIIGTPGRVMDHIKRRNFKPDGITLGCLDEADEMLSMGFYPDVTAILNKCNKELQIFLFSATMNPATRRLVDQYLRDPLEIMLSTDTDHVEGIEHIAYETDTSFHKTRALLYVIDLEEPKAAIIFCNTREDVNTVCTFLARQGLNADMLSGELAQNKRNQVMARIKAKEVQFLVATDVAARGIDISHLSHVFNYSLPKDAAVYMHRVGRTGRIGNKGRAISLIGGGDIGTRKTLEISHQIVFEEKIMPTRDGCMALRVDKQLKHIKKAKGSVLFEAYLPTARTLLAQPDAEHLVATVLKGFFEWDQLRKAQQSRPRRETEYAPEPRGRGKKSSTYERSESRTESLDDLLSEAPPKKRKKVKAPKAKTMMTDDLDDLLSEAPPKKRKKAKVVKKKVVQKDDLDDLLSAAPADDLDAFLS